MARGGQVLLYPTNEQRIKVPVLLPPVGPGAVDVDLGDAASIERFEVRQCWGSKRGKQAGDTSGGKAPTPPWPALAP